MAGDFNEDLMNGTFFTELKKEWGGCQFYRKHFSYRTSYQTD